MKILCCGLLVTFLIYPAPLVGDEGTGGGTASITGDGDQFERAMLEIIAAAAREGKKVTVKRMDHSPAEGAMSIGPAPRRTPVTSVIAVEIRDPDAVEEPAQQILLRNQEEIIKALNVVCEGQLEAEGKLSNVAGLSSELDQTMRGLTSNVDSVNEGVSSTYSEVRDVSEVTQDSAVTIEGIKAELKKLNQTVQGLLSSMGGIEEGIGALAASAEGGAEQEESQEVESSREESERGRDNENIASRR